MPLTRYIHYNSDNEHLNRDQTYCDRDKVFWDSDTKNSKSEQERRDMKDILCVKVSLNALVTNLNKTIIEHVFL